MLLKLGPNGTGIFVYHFLFYLEVSILDLVSKMDQLSSEIMDMRQQLVF